MARDSPSKVTAPCTPALLLSSTTSPCAAFIGGSNFRATRRVLCDQRTLAIYIDLQAVDTHSRARCHVATVNRASSPETNVSRRQRQSCRVARDKRVASPETNVSRRRSKEPYANRTAW